MLTSLQNGWLKTKKEQLLHLEVYPFTLILFVTSIDLLIPFGSQKLAPFGSFGSKINVIVTFTVVHTVYFSVLFLKGNTWSFPSNV